MKSVFRSGQLLAAAIVSLGAAQPAAAATLLGQQVKITESVGGVYFAYGWAGVLRPNQVLNRTIGAGVEVGASDYATDMLGDGRWLPTTLDIDPLNNRIVFNYFDYPYNVFVQLAPWTVTLDLPANSPVGFSALGLYYNTSAYQSPGASFTARSITFNLGGGFNNPFRPNQPAVYTSQWSFALTQLAAGVPEPDTWAMVIAGFAAIGFSMRRKNSQQTRVRFAF